MGSTRPAARLKTLWEQAVASLWFMLAVLTVGGAVLAIVAITLGDSLLRDLDASSLWWLFGGGAEGARGVLSAVAGGIITVTGVVFSVTIVALQLASTQLSPRVLRQFMADRVNQVVLGVFIATFTYTLLVLRTVRAATDGDPGYVPSLAVTGAVVLALVSIGFLIYFIHHLADSIQADSVIHRVASDTLHVIDRLHVDERDGARPAAGPAEVADREDPDAERVPAVRAGYVQHVQEDKLLSLADEHSLVVRVDARVGDFVLPDQPLLSIWPRRCDGAPSDEELRTAIAMGSARTPHQDIGLGVVELMDIAVKALSPSVNDPTTAMLAIDRLGEVLLRLAGEPPHMVLEGENGGRVLTRRAEFEQAVVQAFAQIRHFGAGNPLVARHVVRVLGEVAALAQPTARAPLARAIERVRESAEREIADPGDRALVARAAERALARATAT